MTNDMTERVQIDYDVACAKQNDLEKRGGIEVSLRSSLGMTPWNNYAQEVTREQDNRSKKIHRKRDVYVSLYPLKGQLLAWELR